MRVFAASFRRHGRKRIFGKQKEIGESGGRERRDVRFLGVFRGGVGVGIPMLDLCVILGEWFVSRGECHF